MRISYKESNGYHRRLNQMVQLVIKMQSFLPIHQSQSYHFILFCYCLKVQLDELANGAGFVASINMCLKNVKTISGSVGRCLFAQQAGRMWSIVDGGFITSSGDPIIIH